MRLSPAIIGLLFLLAPAVLAQPPAKCPCDCPVEKAFRASKTGSWAQVSVNTNPKGAEVYVDSEYRGVTPLEKVRVPAGNVPVTFLKDGFRRHTMRINLKEGESKSLGTVNLDTAFGEITVKSYPARANVILNGEKLNVRTPVIIRQVPREKPQVIQLQLEGYGTWERVIDLEDQEKKKYDVELEKK